MESTISIPTALLQRAQRLARHMNTSPDRLLTQALAEYVARHPPEDVAEAIDHVVDHLNDPSDRPFVNEAAKRTLNRSEW